MLSKEPKNLHASSRDDQTVGARVLEHCRFETPTQMMVCRAKPWETRWSRDQFQAFNGMLQDALAELARAAEAEDLPPPLEPKLVRGALGAFKSSRGLSTCHLKAGDAKEAPDEAITQLSKILYGVVKLRKWPNPKGKIPVPIHLIPKPAGGDRPIGITPLLAALLIRCLFPLADEWDEERMNFWEDAVKGSSALKAGLFRRLLDECAVLVGKETVSIF